MDTAELILNFPSPDQVIVLFDGTDSGQLRFTNPISEKDRRDIRWYVETYGAKSLADPDDAEARRIETRLPEIGKALFRAVFQAGEGEAKERYLDFRNADARQRVLTVSSQDASILSIPWELLHDPTGNFLFREKPHISIRRKITGATGGRKPFRVKAKECVHLLFVVSRPSDAGFLDPRADPQAVLDALGAHAAGRVTWEFLYPATLKALVERLDDESQPVVDILHFDGHGVFTQVSEDDAKNEPSHFGKSIFSEIQRERQRRGEETGKPVGIGFLLFENEDGTKHLVSAADLEDNLFQHKVGLIVLSACQTAAMDTEGGDPMASVAGKLTHTGIPAILAMTHSVLVATTRTLFGKFYESLARGRGIATSLDDARTFLDLPSNRQKYEVQRGSERKKLELQDWFVPALFHGGNDSPLLTKIALSSANESTDLVATFAERAATTHNLRDRHEAGFFGRRHELWNIERWFANGQTRRISITGFGGQGKTELALEAGRWLLQTGMFRQAVFVDYSRVQSLDPVAAAISTMSAVLGETLVDTDAATDLLAAMPTLVILDNMETIPEDALPELLRAAKRWSEAGDSRVLLTSRIPDIGHPDFAIQGTFKHRRIKLDGLGSSVRPDDALAWFGQLNRLPSAEPPQLPPPRRDELIALFDRVQFHPLSICVLVQQLKTRTAGQLEKRLDKLLAEDAALPMAVDGTPKSLIASLQLSLERLSEVERRAARQLGVFQGGAMEPDLLAITGLGAIPEAGGDNLWPGLRRRLEAAALIEVEWIEGVRPPFLRFHPTLAPMLWSALNADERDALVLAHRQTYYALANYLYEQDFDNPREARKIARRELPNLLYAVHQALDAADPDAVEFVDAVNLFLWLFGMTREAALLARRAEQAVGERGSREWYLAQSGRGQQLLAAGKIRASAEIFTDIRQTLGDKPSYELAVTLSRLGRCYEAGGRPNLAKTTYRQGIAVTLQLEQTAAVKRHRSILQSCLADALASQGHYQKARKQYEKALATKRKNGGDQRGEGVVLGKLGSLALQEGDLAQALTRNHDALALFERLGEPAMQAVTHDLLGMAYRESREWETAEHHFRESVHLKEQLGDLPGVAHTWNSLALLNAQSGKPDAAKSWYEKTIAAARRIGDKMELAQALSQFAYLQNQLGRLDEARQLAEEALAIEKTLDPDAAQIWSTYNILAVIADQKSAPQQAAEYLRLARLAKRNFAGNSSDLKRHLPLIVGTLEAIQQPATSEKFRTALSTMEGRGWANLVAAINRILIGERNLDSLCERLGPEGSIIIETILAAIDDPTTLCGLHPSESDHE